MKLKFGLLLSVLMACALSMVACKVERTPSTSLHKHSLDYHQTVLPTCTEEGNIEYWGCAECGKKYSDETATIELKSVVLEALGHDFSEKWVSGDEEHWHECTRCGEIEARMPHEWGAGNTVNAPTCTEDGLIEYVCDVCNKTRTEIIPARHTFSTEWSGNDECHWRKCEFCGEVTDEAQHVSDDGDTCAICGYVYRYTVGLSFKPINNNSEYEVTMASFTDGDIVIPESFNGVPVTTIASNAFFMTDITSISIPASVNYIGKQAFFSCTKLTSVNIADVAAWCAMEFESDTTATSNPLKYGQLYVNGELANTLVIPDEVQSVNSSVFRDCKTIINLVMGTNVQSIGANAFRNCDNLANIFYKGANRAAWDLIHTGSNNDNLTGATIYYYRADNPFEGEGAAESGFFWHYDTDNLTPVIWQKENA